MKTRTILSIILIVLAGCRSGIDSDKGKEELKTLILEYYNAMSGKDLAKMKELTTSNFIFFDEGVVYNNESALRSIEQLGDFKASFRLDSFNAYISKANSSAYYFRDAEFRFGDSTYPAVRFLESATFRKEDDKWKMRFLHSTLRKEALPME